MKLLSGIHFYSFMSWLLSLSALKKEAAADLGGLVISILIFGFVRMGVDDLIHEEITRFAVWTAIGFVIFRFAFSVCAALSEEYARIRALSVYDTLTGLHNRNYLHEATALTFALAQINKEDFGVLVLDGNKIKEINDLYGHNVGDKAIKEIAEKIQKIVYRRHDVIIRLGGDEFVVICSSNNMEIMCERIRNFFNEGNLAIYVNNLNKIIPLSVAVGMAFAPATKEALRGRSIDELYGRLFIEADADMYNNKVQGK